MKVPEKLINFRVYEDGNDLIGVADVELPSLKNLSDTIKGAGIAGEVDSPVLGHFGSMGVKINWRTVTKPTITLAQQRVCNLDLRGAIQVLDAGKGEYKVTPLRVVIRGTPKDTVLGKMDVGVKMDSSNEFEVTYIKILLDGKKLLEIDKYNYICEINGVDYHKDVRTALGI